VSDTPSESLVADIAAVFTSSGTDIKTTLRALVDHPEFLSSATPKVRTPAEDYVATCRALRLKALQPTLNADLGNYSIWQATSIGPRPFNWPTPDGFPDVSDAWASATRMLGSWDVHHAMANSWVKGGVEYPALSSWLPALPVSFDQLVSAVSVRLLFEPATPEVVTAAAAAVGVGRGEIITATHKLVTQRMPLLLAVLLDSPLHMNR
jgi:hypothetical protein